MTPSQRKDQELEAQYDNIYPEQLNEMVIYNYYDDKLDKESIYEELEVLDKDALVDAMVNETSVKDHFLNSIKNNSAYAMLYKDELFAHWLEWRDEELLK